MPIQWNDVKKWVSDTADTAVKESKELARKGKIQVDIMSLRHQTTLALTELGSTVYELIRKEKAVGVAGNDKVKETGWEDPRPGAGVEAHGEGKEDEEIHLALARKSGVEKPSRNQP